MLPPCEVPLQEKQLVRTQLRHYLNTNWEIKIRLFFIAGTQRTLLNWKVLWDVLREEESVWVMDGPEPSPIIMSSEPLYEVCMERLFRSAVIWWEAPLSKS
jgi:hypothetical protein